MDWQVTVRVLAYCRRDPAEWPAWRILLPHIEAVASHAPPDADTGTTAYLLNLAGLVLEDQAQPAHAAGHLQRAIADFVQVLGEDHPDTLTARGGLAGTYQARRGTWAGPSRCSDNPSRL